MNPRRPHHLTRLSGACSPQSIRSDDARRRHAQAVRVLRHGPVACMWRRTRAGRATLTVVADVPLLCDRIDRLERVRRCHQDLEAAARATLAASAEGEADFLYYLRDELAASRPQPSDGETRPW
jgi:hypothetical protein